MRRFWQAFAALLIAASAQAATEFPALTGRVVDNAHVLSPATRQSLENNLAAEEASTGNQLVVVTVPSLHGQSIEDFGVALGRHWGIGQKGRDNGVLLIVAPADHRVRIEVGYGLEGTLTDAQASAIVQTIILPQFRRGAVEAGVVQGVQAIESALGGNAPAVAPATDQAPSHGSNAGVGLIAALLALFLFSQVVLFVVYLIGALLGAILSVFGFTGLRDSMRRYRAKIFPADRAVLLWLLMPSHRIGGYTGGSSGGFSGGGGFGGGGSSGSW